MVNAASHYHGHLPFEFHCRKGNQGFLAKFAVAKSSLNLHLQISFLSVCFCCSCNTTCFPFSDPCEPLIGPVWIQPWQSESAARAIWLFPNQICHSALMGCCLCPTAALGHLFSITVSSGLSNLCTVTHAEQGKARNADSTQVTRHTLGRSWPCRKWSTILYLTRMACSHPERGESTKLQRFSRSPADLTVTTRLEWLIYSQDTFNAILVPVCPHAGGVGLCELVQHLSLFDYIAVSGSLENRYLNPRKQSMCWMPCMSVFLNLYDPSPWPFGLIQHCALFRLLWEISETGIRAVG